MPVEDVPDNDGVIDVDDDSNLIVSNLTLIAKVNTPPMLAP